MGRCRALCGHRDIVMGYRHARAAEVAERESVSRGGWARRDDPAANPITFKRWLVDNKVPEEYRDSA